MARVFLILAACAGAAAGPAARGQPPEKPGKEMELLKAMVGTWDVTAKASGSDSTGTGTAVMKLELGGRWVTSEIKVELLGHKYEQRGLGTYDAGKKKYVFAWADSLSTTLHSFEGTYDEAAKKLTAVGESPGLDGKPVKIKMAVEIKGNDRFVQTLFNVGGDGKEQEVASLTYTRKK